MAALILFDTDILIDFLRGSPEAELELLAVPVEKRAASTITAMELAVGARDRRDLAQVEAFLAAAFGSVAEIDEEISRLARSLVGTYSLSHGLRIPDALIAATARHLRWPLVTGNLRHFAFIPDLDARLPAYRQVAP